MLQAIRSKAGSFLVKLLFGALIVSFGVWGIGDIFRNGGDTDPVVATAGDQSIRVEVVQKAMQPALERLRAQLGSGVDMHQAKQLGLVDTVMNQLVDRALVDQEVARLRLDVSDAVVRTAVFDNPDFHDKSGRFDRTRFDALLAANHLTEDEYVGMVRRDMPSLDLIQALTAGAAAPQAVVDTIFRYRNEKRVADVVAFPLAKVAAAPAPSDAVLTKFYNAHKEMFQAPEYRGFTLLSLTQAQVIDKIDIPEAKLRQEYDQRRAAYEQPEQRDVQQILCPSEAVAKEALAALAKGGKWNTVATTLAKQDPSTIDLGMMTRKDMPKLLADIAFVLPLNKPSAPVKSPLGWHVLRVVKIVPGQTETFAQAKPKLKVALARDDAADQLYKTANQVDDAIAGGASLAEVTSKYGLTETVVPAVDVDGHDRAGTTMPLPLAPSVVVKSAFDNPKGQTTRVHETQDGGIFLLHTDSETPPQTRPLAEVKDTAIAAWQLEQKREAVAKEAAALVAAAKPPALLAGVAHQQGLTATMSPPLLRDPTTDGQVPPALVAKLFDAKPGAVFTVSDDTGAYAVQLAKIEPAGAPTKAEAAALHHELDAAMQNDLGDEFTAALRQRFPVTIDHAVLDPLF